MHARRLRSLIALSAMTASLWVASPSSAAPSPIHVVEGSVAMMMRFPADPTYTSWVKPARDVYNITGQTGQAGYAFDIQRRTWGGRFVLEL
ncbi:MAG TPA: hypothetical protein VM841_08550, partial [Actinomycetota bacterium]|nr:hypothetical protein [Actinomycetota bacterium]